MKTFKEVIETYLKSNNEAGDYEIQEELKKHKLVYKVVDEVGNREGGGDYSHLVFYVVEEDKYYKLEGYYSSYNGTYWNGFVTEVYPKEKTIIVYEPTK